MTKQLKARDRGNDQSLPAQRAVVILIRALN
jgi:hypothetical protein